MNRRLLSLTLVLVLVFNGVIGVVNAQDPVSITIRCMASPPEENWRCNNFAEVEEAVEAELGIELDLNLIQDNVGWADYKTEFVLAADANEAPDIILSGHEDIGAWAPAGYIIPLDDMIAEHEEFADIVPALWESQRYEGVTYGVPQDAEARPIFFSKLLLGDLGWSEEEIESLPERVAAGEYTFEDMLATALEAIDEGVVEPGNGYWHRPSNGFDWLIYYYGMGGEVMTEDGELVLDQEALLATYELIGSLTESGATRPDMLGVSNNEVVYPTISTAEDVLFFQGGTWQWSNWALNFVQAETEEERRAFLLENIDLMLFPAMDAGVPITLTHPLTYMIYSGSEHPDVAMALIAAITTPEANNRHAIDSFHLGILNAQVESEEYQNDPVLSSAHYMLDYTTNAPNTPLWSSWSNAYWAGIQAVHTGTNTAEEAVDIMIDQAINELGDDITIR
ncbi:ABC transporter substrate-binding protein [Chloroflexota bacterium]